jgi:hypothetical protein
MIIIDSIGNLAFKKEVDDALDRKSTADMTRAKQLKSLFRIVVPHLTIKDIPMVVVNHTYKEMALYPKDILSGGTGSYYNPDNIWIVGRQQEKDADGIQGYHFIIRVEKSRYVRESSKIPITVMYDSGINKWSGLFDVALEGGYITKVKNGWYAVSNPTTGEISGGNLRAAAMVNDGEFWEHMLNETSFSSYIEKKYSLDIPLETSIVPDDEIADGED